MILCLTFSNFRPLLIILRISYETVFSSFNDVLLSFIMHEFKQLEVKRSNYKPAN